MKWTIFRRSLFVMGMLLFSMFIMAQNVVTHTVKRGESLESIASKYRVSVDEIKRNNPYAEEAFYVGLKLYIPVADEPESRNQEIRNSQPVTTNYAQPQGYGQTATSRSNFESQEQDGGCDIQYHAIDEGWGIGIDWVNSYVVFGYDYYFGKENDVLTKNMGMEVYLGGNYRYHITENLYLEGRVFAGWYHWETKAKKNYGGEETKTNEAFLGVSPRAGLKFGPVAISAGYRWDWVKFKFKKENCLDRFTVGLTIIL